MTTIRTAGLEIHGSRRPGETGLFLRRAGLQGWEGLPASRREALAREMQHGELDLRTWLPARVVTIDGLIYGSSERDLQERMRRVSGWGADGRRLTVSVEMLGAETHALGRRVLASPRAVSPHTFRGEFQMQVVFADPRRYGETKLIPDATTATVVDVAHDGNFPAFPAFEFPEAPGSYTITSPAGTFTVAGATPGGYHRVDMRTGFVTRNGVRMPGVGRGVLWTIPNGPATRHEFSVPGRAVVDDTYI